MDQQELSAAVRQVWDDPKRFQPLTAEDRAVFEEPAIIILAPPLSSDPASAHKRRNWIDWRGAPYPAERHAEYVLHAGELSAGAHPRILLSAVLDISSGMASYLAAFDKKQRYQVTGRKAENAGFAWRPIHPAEHAVEIWEIIHSSATRQGRAIARDFEQRGRDHRFPEYQRFDDPNYADICVGAFAPAGALVAYILGKRVGDHVQYDEIMGHADYLSFDIVFLAHHALLHHALRQEVVPRCLNYGPWYSGANPFSPQGGLNFWKRKNRFRPAYLINASC